MLGLYTVSEQSVLNTFLPNLKEMETSDSTINL